MEPSSGAAMIGVIAVTAVIAWRAHPRGVPRAGPLTAAVREAADGYRRRRRRASAAARRDDRGVVAVEGEGEGAAGAEVAVAAAVARRRRAAEAGEGEAGGAARDPQSHTLNS